MSFIVGLTGGIGSGKTAVSDRFAARGIAVVDADVAARTVVEPGTAALAAIRERFGDGILLADGHLDRAGLRQRVFSQPQDKQWLEALLHPLIGDQVLRAIAAADSPWVLFVSPLLVESGMDAICDRVLLVDAPEAVQLERTMQRDANSRAQVEAIMASQASRAQRRARADDLIDNSGDLAALDAQVAALDAHYRQLAAGKTQRPPS